MPEGQRYFAYFIGKDTLKEGFDGCLGKYSVYLFTAVTSRHTITSQQKISFQF
jgi:hypothetical protein